MKYPVTIITKRAKLAYTARRYGKLQEEHNIMGNWYDLEKPTITLGEYNKLGLQVRLQYPFGSIDKISEDDWESYKTNRFNPKHTLVMTELCRMKLICYESNTYDPDIDEI